MYAHSAHKWPPNDTWPTMIPSYCMATGNKTAKKLMHGTVRSRTAQHQTARFVSEATDKTLTTNDLVRWTDLWILWDADQSKNWGENRVRQADIKQHSSWVTSVEVWACVSTELLCYLGAYSIYFGVRVKVNKRDLKCHLPRLSVNTETDAKSTVVVLVIVSSYWNSCYSKSTKLRRKWLKITPIWQH